VWHARRGIEREDEAVAQVRAAYDAARRQTHEITHEHTAEQRAALEQAKAAYDAKLAELLDADPQAAALAASLEKLDAQIAELRDRIAVIEEQKDMI